jgi:hypothetical protein
VRYTTVADGKDSIELACDRDFPGQSSVILLPEKCLLNRSLRTKDIEISVSIEG